MNVVKELIERAGVSQKALAIEIGVSQPTVSDWMHNKKDPRGENLQKVADYFCVSPHVVKGRDPIPKNVMHRRLTGTAQMTDEEKEVWELRENVRRDPERHYLFSMAADAPIDDVRRAVAIMDALKLTREEG